MTNVLTKNEIIQKVKEHGGIFIDTDGIPYDLDGKGMADYLKSLGFHVTKYFDTGRNGLVLTEEGIQVSTNGYCSVMVNHKIELESNGIYKELKENKEEIL